MIDYKTFKEKFIYYFKQNVGRGDLDAPPYPIPALDEKIINDFYMFTDYLLCENKKYNLTSITDIDDIIVKHYIDSIMILKYFDIHENLKIIDIGTGAGFPALPLSIMRKDLKITFLDSSNKKINFIKNAPYDNKNNFIFYCGRAEDFGRDIKIRETYDFAVSRAVAKLNILCELAAAFINPGGFFIAYKSKNADEEITEAKNALKILDLEIEETAEFNLICNPPSLRDTPFQMGAFAGDGVPDVPDNINENKRVLIKIKKLKNTSSKYPRKFSDITKNPL